MAQKHLKELLQEDQEPFYLKDYIADKKCMLEKQAPKTTTTTTTTHIQVKKPKPMSKNTSIFSKNACFFSIQDSPDLRKSPLFDFCASPISKKSPNRVLLQVPAKTASLLLEAAIRIQQKSSKPKTHVKQSSFSLLGSMLKRLTLRNRTHKLKNKNDTDDNLTFPNNNDNNNNVTLNNVTSVSCSSSSCYNGRSSSLDLETCSSGRSFDDDDDEEEEEFEFVNILKESGNIGSNDDTEDYGALCLSPFRFPTTSPSPHIIQDHKSYEQDKSVKCELGEDDEDEEDKEQNSPVSVLDPPFEDDYDGHDEDYYDQQQCGYALVQRAHQRLLQKLHRFEKLAELDPIELEKRMIEDDQYGNEGLLAEQSQKIDEYDFESFTFTKTGRSPDFFEDVIKKPGIKRLISDLIVEEESIENAMDNDQIMLIKRVCNRLESWKEVECNTIDMMVEMDLKADSCDWKKHRPEISEASIDIEGAIFAVLVKELVVDFAYSADHC